jgi:hypothetical protein
MQIPGASITAPRSCAIAREIASRSSRSRSYSTTSALVPPYDDPLVIAGQRISATNSRRRNQDVRRDRLRAGETSSDATGLLLAALAALALP